MYSVKGEYFIDLKCGGNPVALSTSFVNEFVLTQDMNRLLPTLKVSFADATGIFAHMTPSDASVSQWSMDIGTQLDDYSNSFAFDVYRREADGEVVTSARCQFTGIATVLNNALCCEYHRSFNGSLVTTLTTLAKEIGADDVNISPSLAYSLAVVQPGWTNPRLLNYLQKHLTGSNGEVGYCCFMMHRNRRRVFVFKTYDELLAQPTALTYHVGTVGTVDNARLYGYGIKENPLLSDMAPRAQRYSYFDWTAGKYVESTLQFNGNSLSDNLGYDKKEQLGNYLQDTGRTNETDQKFLGTVGTGHYRRAYSLVKMWATAAGNANLCPGDCIKIVFGSSPVDLFSTQYSGFWLVEKVAHNFGDRFVTYMRLTRNGFDQSSVRTSTLQPATNRKRT